MTARRWLAAAIARVLDLAAAILDRLDPPYGQHAPMVPAAANADSGGGPAPARHAPPWQPAPLPLRDSPAQGEHPYPDGFIVLGPDGCIRWRAFVEPEWVPPQAGTTHPNDRDDPSQHPFDAPVTVAFPDGHAAILDAGGQWRIKPLAFDGRCAETGAQAALVRHAYARHEAWRDAPAMAADANDTLCPRCRNFWFMCTCKRERRAA